MSQSIATRLLQAIDNLLEFVDAHNELTRNPDRTLSAGDIKRLTELDANVESLRIRISGLRMLSCSPSVSAERTFGYTELNIIFRRHLSFAFRASPEWRQRMESFRMTVVGLQFDDKAKNPHAKQPDNPDVRDLCHLLAKEQSHIHSGKKSTISIAREFTHEKPNKDRKARSLLRQARRYPHLWKSADK